MPLTNAGRNFVAAGLNGSPCGLTHIGVGTDSTAFAAAQTDLLGTSTRKGMDAGYPAIDQNVLTLRATFAPGEATGAWNEWGLFSAASSGTMFTRKVQAVGTKPAAQAWRVTVQLNVNYPEIPPQFWASSSQPANSTTILASGT